MRTDQPNREERRAPQEAGRSEDTTRNAEPAPRERETFEHDRKSADDLILHDDDEAELELPR
jgi:hypothetical protein